MKPVTTGNIILVVLTLALWLVVLFWLAGEMKSGW